MRYLGNTLSLIPSFSLKPHASLWNCAVENISFYTKCFSMHSIWQREDGNCIHYIQPWGTCRILWLLGQAMVTLLCSSLGLPLFKAVPLYFLTSWIQRRLLPQETHSRLCSYKECESRSAAQYITSTGWHCTVYYRWRHHSSALKASDPWRVLVCVTVMDIAIIMPSLSLYLSRSVTCCTWT